MRTYCVASRRGHPGLGTSVVGLTPLRMLAVMLTLLSARSAAPAPRVCVLPEAPPPLAIFRNSHATAMAWLVKRDGLSKTNEADKNLIGLCWMYAQYCECDKPGKPIIWRVREGLASVYAARGYELVVNERCRSSPRASERTSFADVSSRIAAGRPVLVTFCYDADSGLGLTVARRREGACLTAVAIGTVEAEDGQYLICRDGLAPGEETAASGDQVKPEQIGLSSNTGPWSESGTSVYKWAGGAKNIVVLYTSAPVGR